MFLPPKLLAATRRAPHAPRRVPARALPVRPLAASSPRRDAHYLIGIEAVRLARPPAIPDRSPGLSRVRFTCQRTPCGGAARSRCTSARCRAPKARRRLRRRPVRRRRRRRDTKRGRPPWSAWVPARCAVRPQAHEKVSPKTHRGTHARSRAVPPGSPSS